MNLLSAVFDFLGITALLLIIGATATYTYLLSSDPYPIFWVRVVRAGALLLLAFRIGVKAFSSTTPTQQSFWALLSVVILMFATNLAVRLWKTHLQFGVYINLGKFLWLPRSLRRK